MSAGAQKKITPACYFMTKVDPPGNIGIPVIVKDRKIGSSGATRDPVLVDLVGKKQLAIIDAAADHPKLETAGDKPGLSFFIPCDIGFTRTDRIGIGAIDTGMFQIAFAKIRG